MDVEEGSSSIPAKRKASFDGAAETLANEARRAYIAHVTPHLLNGEVSESSSPSSSRLGPSPSSSALPSPSPSEDERHTPHTLDSPSQQHNLNGGTASASPHPEASLRQRSHHAVPKRYRGPLPMVGDAEELAPLPSLVPVTSSSSLYNVQNYPMNRNGWRYTCAGPASHSLPQTVYRTLESEPYGVHWSWADRSTFSHLSQDASIVGASGGFRSARANVPVREGSWYVEIHILPPEGAAKGGDHVRLGWGRRESPLNAPVGFNGYSYGMRDATGEKVFLSRTYPYGRSFKPGDVVGMWINLPKVREANQDDALDPARIERKRIPIRYRGRLYFEQLEYAVTKEMEHLMDRSRRGEKLLTSLGPPAHETMVNPTTGMLAMKDERANAPPPKKGSGPPGQAPSRPASSSLRSLPTLGPESQIGFFVNGEAQGIAFENLLDFRPLRRKKSAVSSGPIKAKANPTSGLGSGGKEDEEKIITSSSTAASILKSRENYFDDGALGYFPFVSLYGNARARIVSQAGQFRFPPPADVRRALRKADVARVNASMDVDDAADAFPCRPLSERYNEFMQELWGYDLLDEQKAQIKAEELGIDSSSDEEANGTSNGKGGSKKASKKKLTANGRRTGSSTPVHDDALGTRSNSPQIVVKEEDRTKLEDEAEETNPMTVFESNGVHAPKHSPSLIDDVDSLHGLRSPDVQNGQSEEKAELDTMQLDTDEGRTLG